MKALITGGTGLLGRELLANLSDAVVLSRDPARTALKLGSARGVKWDSATEPAPLEALRGVEAVFNLAGEPVAEGRWTEDKKRHIRDSRVLGTRNLVAGLRTLDRKPAVLVSASAVGYYGDRGDEELGESSRIAFGEMSEILMASQRVLPGVAERTGYAFKHTKLEVASMARRRPRRPTRASFLF